MTLHGLKILLVEDDAIIQEYVSKLLIQHGAKIVGRALDGSRALDLLNNTEPDFVICDIHLGPGMSGIDIAEVIHQKYDIPYIFLTSFDDDLTLSLAEQHSPYGYIIKPFHDRTLISTVKIALSNHQKKSTLHQLSKSSIEEMTSTEFTDQEFSILQQLVDGKSYNQIGASLHLGRDSIKYHAGKIYQRFGIKGRSELASRLAQ